MPAPVGGTSAAGTTSVGGGTGAAPGSGGTGAGGDGPKLDVAAGTAGPDFPGAPCKKVDFLFAIDNSGSMGARQVALANSFPGFITAIQNSVAAQDYHIMVVDSDEVAVMASLSTGCGLGGSCSGICDGCSGSTVCVCSCQNPAVECAKPGQPCEDQLGGGRIHDQSGSDCGVQGGTRYITDGQPDVAGTFQCLALVGDGGMALERPVSAAIRSITDQSESGGCNEGFLRPDALLVVTLITDDPPSGPAVSNYEDAGYLADAEGWYESFVNAKGGNSGDVVMLGILDPSHGAPVFVDLVHEFGDHGLIGDILQSDYSPFFEQAVGLIGTACDEFQPAG